MPVMRRVGVAEGAKNRATAPAIPASPSLWRCARTELGVTEDIHPAWRRPTNLGLQRQSVKVAPAAFGQSYGATAYRGEAS